MTVVMSGLVASEPASLLVSRAAHVWRMVHEQQSAPPSENLVTSCLLSSTNSCLSTRVAANCLGAGRDTLRRLRLGDVKESSVWRGNYVPSTLVPRHAVPLSL